jgi:hypothetical protein
MDHPIISERIQLILANILATLLLLMLFDQLLPYISGIFTMWGYFWLHWVYISLDFMGDFLHVHADGWDD